MKIKESNKKKSEMEFIPYTSQLRWWNLSPHFSLVHCYSITCQKRSKSMGCIFVLGGIDRKARGKSGQTSIIINRILLFILDVS